LITLERTRPPLRRLGGATNGPKNLKPETSCLMP
jgi:hypothetical protein